MSTASATRPAYRVCFLLDGVVTGVKAIGQPHP